MNCEGGEHTHIFTHNFLKQPIFNPQKWKAEMGFSTIPSNTNGGLKVILTFNTSDMLQQHLFENRLNIKKVMSKMFKTILSYFRHL